MRRHDNLTTEEVFTVIYKQNKWGSQESHSGAGSTLVQTETLRRDLPKLLQRYDIKTMLDLPCGDHNWISHIDLPLESYIGGDIVPDLIQTDVIKYSCPSKRFKVLDLLTSDLPEADLILCRDCLVHLSPKDIAQAISNLQRSSIKYLLATTFTNHKSNRDIRTGGWCPYNLQLHPFYFPEPIELLVENCPEDYPNWLDKSLGFWEIANLPKLGAN